MNLSIFITLMGLLLIVLVSGEILDHLNNVTIVKHDPKIWKELESGQDVVVGDNPELERGLNGTIDELGFWNRSLSAEEVSEIYNIQNGTYYWYMESNEYNATNSRVNSSLFQFIVGEQANSCVYTLGNWDINRADNCIINSDVIGDTGANMIISGTGNFSLNGANISGFNDYIFKKDCIDSSCEDFIINRGSLG